jgi:glycosyltransferase involved in cell wall biosynthesis
MKARILRYAIAEQRVHVIPVWADGRQIRAVPRAENWFVDQQGLGGRFVVLYSGNLTVWESFDTVFGAAELLRPREDIVFLFIGAGAPRERLRAAAERKGLTNFRFLPYQRREDLAFSLSAGDAHLVLMGREAGMRVPSKTYGILAVGGPLLLVGNDPNEVSDLISQHQLGFHIQEGDSSALAEAILTLHGNAALRAEIRTRARRVFESDYALERVVKRHENVLLAVTGGRRKDARAPTTEVLSAG